MIEGLKPYAEYKESGLPWLGRCPKHWNVRRTKILFHERVQKGFPNEPLLAATQTKGVVKKEDYETRTVTAQKDLHLLKLVEVGDYVISLRSFQGGIEVAHCRGIISPAYTVLKPQKQAVSRYYSHFFKAKPFIDSLSLFVTGIREGQNIDYERLSRAEMPMPPEEEQAAIVRFLDHANRKIDGFIRAKRKLIGLLNEQKQAIIHRAVTGKDEVRMVKDENGNSSFILQPSTLPKKPSGIPWLGDIPQHWEVKKLRFLFRYSKGSRAAELTNEYIGHNAGAFPVFSGQTEHGGLMGRINWHEFDFAAPVVFVSTVGARAMTTRILTGKFSLSQNCALIIPRTKLANPIYFENVFQRLFSFERYSISQIMQPSLRFADLNRFYVPHPPIEEQIEIAASIELESEKLNTAIARTEREIALMQEYRTRLTADLVTGKLDVREAAAHLPAPPSDAVTESTAEEPLEDIETEGIEP
jgi:type I restriction enzyme S subunit